MVFNLLWPQIKLPIKRKKTGGRRNLNSDEYSRCSRIADASRTPDVFLMTGKLSPTGSLQKI